MRDKDAWSLNDLKQSPATTRNVKVPKKSRGQRSSSKEDERKRKEVGNEKMGAI